MGDQWGICVEGGLGRDGLRHLGQVAEACGYSSVWFNVVGDEHHPVELMQALAEETGTIDLGVGVVPLDRYGTEDLGARLARSGLAMDRWILGLGAGQIRQGALDAVGDAVARLRSVSPDLRVGIGAYGPNMLKVAGRVADAVNLNWMTPERLDWATGQIALGVDGRAESPIVYLYHRVAGGPDGATRLRAEMAAYAQFPVHQRHQKAVGEEVLIGITTDDRRDVASALAAYSSACEHVLRPIPAERGSVAAWAEVLQQLAPSVCHHPEESEGA